MRVFLRFDGRILGNGDITEELSLTEQSGAEGQCVFGGAMAAELKFEAENCGGELDTSSIAGDFELFTGEDGEALSIFNDYRADMGARQGLYLQYGDRAFCCDGELFEAGEVPPEQPASPIGAIFVADGVLYCAHEQAPFVSAYSLEGGLAPMDGIAPDEYDKKRLKALAKKRAAFTLERGEFARFFAVRRNGALRDYRVVRARLFKRGEFTVESVKRKNDRLLSVTAYDGMTALDADASLWLKNTAYPAALGEKLGALCADFDTGLASADFINADYVLRRGFEGAVTARQIAGFASQLACGFARMDGDGRLRIRAFAPTEAAFGASDIISAALEDRPCGRIDKVSIKVTDEDVGCSVGDGSRALVIQNNPLLYALNEGELSTAANNIYQAANALCVTAGTVKLTGARFEASVGDIVSLTMPGGREVPFYVMKRRISGVNFCATVLQAFDVKTSEAAGIKTSIIMLRGATNKLTRLMDQTTSTITQLFGRLSAAETSIVQNASAIALKAAKTAVDALGERVSAAESALTVQANQITAKVSQSSFNALGDRVSTAESGIKQNATAITSKVSQASFNALGTRVSTAESGISQNASAITSKVSKDGVISSINQTAESVKISASKLTLDGLITAAGLSGGTTTIDGACIKTGKISADRINVPNIDAGKITSGKISADRLDASVVTAASLTAGGVTVKTGSGSNWTEIKTGGINCYTASRDVLIANGVVYVGTNDGWSGTHGGQIEAYSGGYGEKGVSVKAPSGTYQTGVVNIDAGGVIYASTGGTQRMMINTAGVHLPNLPTYGTSPTAPVYVDTNGKLYKGSAAGSSASGWTGTLILLNCNNTPTLVDVSNGIITNATTY